ncbi:MAG: hypothetical protein WCH98_14950 [Verrucomicrobiota bacterium]
MRAITTFAAAWLIVGNLGSFAVIFDGKQINIDFTDAVDAESKATWSDPDKIMVSNDGLGWDGEADSSRDGWIRTKPIALGLSWRPTSSIYVRFAIQPPPLEITLKNGQTFTPDGGDMYVRYSPDLKHWSSWQELPRSEPKSVEEKKKPGRYFSGRIGVPRIEQSEYGRLVSDYSQMDVPWKSDEEAAVEWILDRDPEFFSKHIPFIGYAEFLFEGGFHGGQRIQSLKAEILYSMGGMHTRPKDEAVSKNRDVPWRYEDKKDQKTER